MHFVIIRIFSGLGRPFFGVYFSSFCMKVEHNIKFFIIKAFFFVGHIVLKFSWYLIQHIEFRSPTSLGTDIIFTLYNEFNIKSILLCVTHKQVLQLSQPDQRPEHESLLLMFALFCHKIFLQAHTLLFTSFYMNFSIRSCKLTHFFLAFRFLSDSINCLPIFFKGFFIFFGTRTAYHPFKQLLCFSVHSFSQFSCSWR